MTYNKVPQKNRNGHLADRGHVDGRLLLNGRAIEVAIRGKVDADGSLPDELGRDLVFLGRHAADDDIAEGKALLQGPVLLVFDLVAWLLDSLATREELDVVDVYGVDGGTVVGEEGGQGSAVDLGPVDNGDGLSVEPVAVREDGVVDLEMLENLDHSQRRAGEDGLLQVLGGVKESDVVVHVVEVLVAEAFDVLL